MQEELTSEIKNLKKLILSIVEESEKIEIKN